jgi:hypothetical protein
MEAAPIEIGYPFLMRHRLTFLLGIATISLGMFGLACSTKTLTDDDSGMDGSLMDVDMADMKAPDTGVDGGMKIPLCSTYPIKGECDPVSQNCMGGKECTVVVDGGMPVTICDTPKTGSVPKGGVCSKPADCVAGSDCISGRCAPACCEGSDLACGNSVPEGYIGTCSINVQYVQNMPNLPTGRACAYASDCKPYQIKPCPMGSTCLVQDQAGKAGCSSIFQPPGKMLGASCSAANDCADGMMCASLGADAGFQCLWVCYKNTTNNPYPMSISTLPPGQGGCPSNKACNAGGFSMLPTWLGVCSL